MARRSLAEVAELSGPGELSCNWAMLHGGSRRKPATKGRPERKSLTGMSKNSLFLVHYAKCKLLI